MKNSSSYVKLSILGVVLFLSSIFMARSLVFPVTNNLFDNCAETGFYNEGLGAECTVTPFITTGVVGGIIFLILLAALGKSFIDRKGGGFILFGVYVILTVALGVFWRDVMILSPDIQQALPEGRGLEPIINWIGQPLSPETHNGYSYLYLWLHIVAGMVLGMTLSQTDLDRKKSSKRYSASSLKKSAPKKQAAAKKKAPAKKK